MAVVSCCRAPSWHCSPCVVLRAGHSNCLSQKRFLAAGMRSQQSTAQRQQASAGTLPRCQPQAVLKQVGQLDAGHLLRLSPGACTHHMVQRRVSCLCMHLLWRHDWHQVQRMQPQRLEQRMQSQCLEQRMQPEYWEQRLQFQVTP